MVVKWRGLKCSRNALSRVCRLAICRLARHNKDIMQAGSSRASLPFCAEVGIIRSLARYLILIRDKGRVRRVCSQISRTCTVSQDNDALGPSTMWSLSLLHICTAHRDACAPLEAHVVFSSGFRHGRHPYEAMWWRSDADSSIACKALSRKRIISCRNISSLCAV